MIRLKDSENKKEKEKTNNITSKGNPQDQDRTNQVTNANEYRQVQTDIEVRKHAINMCRVFGYEPHDALSRLTEEICETRHRSLVKVLSSLSKNLLYRNTLLDCVLYTSFKTTFGKDYTCVICELCMKHQ